MSDLVEIRLARPDELAEVGAITVAGYAHDGFLLTSDPYADRLRDAAARAAAAELWVAAERTTGRLVGTVTFCLPGSAYSELATETEGEFRMLAVDPSARGLGVGRALVEHCLQRSRDLGFTGVVICSLPVMTTAHRLYATAGFARDTGLDFTPVPDVELWGFRADLRAGVSDGPPGPGNG